MTPLSQVLQQARLSRGLSLREMQKLSDNTITCAYIAKLEKSSQVPSPKKLRVLADILKLDFLELMIIAGHVNRTDIKK